MKTLILQINSFVRREFYNYKKSEFFNNVIKLFSASVFAQLIALITAPIITRLYSPENYGKLAIFTTIAGVLGSVVCLQYNRAIVLCNKDEDAVNVSFICLLLCIITIIIILTVNYFFNENIMKLLDLDGAASWLYWVPVIVLTNGLFLIAQAINVRSKDFGVISKSRILDVLSVKVSVIGIAVFGSASAVGLIWGTVIGTVVRTCYIFMNTINFLMVNIRYISIEKSWLLVKLHKKFPFFLSWSGLLFTVNEAVPIWMITYHFSIEYAGCYTLVRGLLLRPSRFIAEAISQPYYQKISSLTDNKGEVHNITKKLMRRMIPLTILIYGILAVSSPYLFPFVFGEDWLTAGKIAQILALYMGARFCTKSINMFFSAFGLQHIELMMQVALFFSVVLSFAFLANYYSFYVVLIVYAVLSTVINLGIVFYAYFNVIGAGNY